MNNSRVPPPPQKMYEHLNGHIVGHYVMKKALTVSIYNHFCDTATIEEGKDTGPLPVESTKHQLDLMMKSAISSNIDRERRDSDHNILMAGDSPEEYMSPIVSRVIIEASSHKVHLRKSNAITFDPTGSGRPLGAIASIIASYLEVPYLRIDCTKLVSTKRQTRQRLGIPRRGSLGLLLHGYLGETIKDSLVKLYKKAEGDLQLCERSIVFLDRMDEVGAHALEDGDDLSVVSKKILSEIQEVIDGTTVSVGPGQDLDTAQLFFICFGVNQIGIGQEEEDSNNEMARMSTASSTSLSYRSAEGGSGETCESCSYDSDSDDDSEDEEDDEKRYSEGLRENKLARMLLACSGKSSHILQCQSLWGMKDVELKITPEALEVIANQARNQNAGHDGVATIMEKLLFTVKFDMAFRSESSEAVKAVEITEDTVLGKSAPIFHTEVEVKTRSQNLNSEVTTTTASGEQKGFRSRTKSLPVALTEFEEEIIKDLEI